MSSHIHIHIPKPPPLAKSDGKEKVDSGVAVAEFAREAKESFVAIINCSGLNTSQKYAHLNQLRHSIRTVRKTHPDQYNELKLRRLRVKVRNATKELRESYVTNSHWLARTMQHGRHMQTMKPDPRKAPTIRLTLDDIGRSLNNIAGLKRGIDQIRALQYLNKMVSDELAKVEKALIEAKADASTSSEGSDEELDAAQGTSSHESEEEVPTLKSDHASAVQVLTKKREYLFRARRLITEFGDKYLDFKQKISLVFKISEWDGDPIQELELKSLIDKFGSNFATFFFLKKGISLEQLFDSFLLLLKEVHAKNPGLTPLEILQKWPISELSLPKPLDIVDFHLPALMAMTEAPGFFDDPFVCVVHEYLLNFIDCDGMLRFTHLHEQARTGEINAGEFYKKVGELVYVLRLYGLPYKHIFDRIKPVKQRSRKVTAFSDVLPLMRKGIGGRRRGQELKQLARSLRAQVASMYIRVTEKSGVPDSVKVGQLYLDNGEHGKRLRSFVLSQVVGAESTRERVALIGNFMYLASQLASLGSYYASYIIMNALERTKYESADVKEAWDQYKTLKSYRMYESLNALFHPFPNFKAYRTEFADREAKGVLCLPMMSIFKGELDKLKQVGKQNRDTVTKSLMASMTEDEFDEICKRLYLDVDDSGREDREWRVQHFLDDVEKLLQVLDQVEIDALKVNDWKEQLQEYLEAKLNAEVGVDAFSRVVISLGFALQFERANKPATNLSEDFLDMIETQEVIELGV